MERPPQVTFKNMATSPALEALITKRIERLEKLRERIMGCRVVVEVPHRSPASAKVPLAITIEVEVPARPMLVASAEDDRRALKADDTAFINQAFEAIERQLKDSKETHGREAVARQQMDSVTGVVARLFPDQDYGFIEIVGSPELYFGRDALVGVEFGDLAEGMLVEVTVSGIEGPMGPQASSLRLRSGKISAS